MADVLRDPKGYYASLGIGDNADDAAIKSAYRAKAKRLHPDFNPSPIAAKQFHRLHDAYATLIDPKKRATYDRPWKIEPAGQAKSAEKPPPPRPEPETIKPTPRRADPAAPVYCQCGQVTAQPRYVIFDMVWGQLKRVHRRSFAGVYCRTCADKAAVRASLITWIAGWWAWPDGPRETVRALLNNIRGGRKPADRNARLLMRQARAFQARGEPDLARSAAEQARSFARTREVRLDVERVIAGLAAGSGKVLKDRWNRPGWAPMVQILPLALFGAVIAASVTMSLQPAPGAVARARPTPPVAAPIEIIPVARPAPPLPQAAPASEPTPIPARNYDVTVDQAALRTGPADSFQIIVLLARGTRLRAFEADPSNLWLRVALPDGSAGGFVASGQVSVAATESDEP